MRSIGRSGEDKWNYRGNSLVCGPHGDVIGAAEHEQDTLLVVDCVPARYGMTHLVSKYYYLHDRRPELYDQLVSLQAGFLAVNPPEVNLSTDFLQEGYAYSIPV